MADKKIQLKNSTGTDNLYPQVKSSNIVDTIADAKIASASTWNAKQDALPTTTTAGKLLTSTSTAGTVEWADAPETGVTDVQINSTSITSSGVANLVTETAYDASTNKIATMSDLPQGETSIDFNGTATTTTEALTNVVVDSTTYTIPQGTVTGITMNGSSKGTSGVVDLGTVLTAHQTLSDLGITATATELNYTDGVTSNIQTQLDSKQATLATQTAYTTQGTSTKVPQITTNTLGQVTGITEVDINFPVTGVTSITAGTGLTGGTITSEGTIAIDDSVVALQSDIPDGEVDVTFNSSSTTTTTETLTNIVVGEKTYTVEGGGGTVTSVIAGTGLTGGTITKSGTLAVDTDVIQAKITDTNKLSADLISDGTTNHVFTATDDTNLTTLVTNVGTHTVATDVPTGAVFTDTKPKYNGVVVTDDTDIPEVKTATWDAKQDALTAGAGISITSNVISADLTYEEVLDTPEVVQSASSPNVLTLDNNENASGYSVYSNDNLVGEVDN